MKTANGERKERRMANSEWRMVKDGEWRAASGEQRMKTANGERKKRRIANGE
jgi:hypothetical protein